MKTKRAEKIEKLIQFKWGNIIYSFTASLITLNTLNLLINWKLHFLCMGGDVMKSSNVNETKKIVALLKWDFFSENVIIGIMIV